MRSVAIDFATANNSPDSACGIGLVHVELGRIVRRLTTKRRPPTRELIFTHVHGLTWSDCATAPTFAAFWPKLVSLRRPRRELRRVRRPRLLRPRPPPMLTPASSAPFASRQSWSLYPTKLPDVARHLGIPLRHHDPASEAGARVGRAAHRGRVPAIVAPG